MRCGWTSQDRPARARSGTPRSRPADSDLLAICRITAACCASFCPKYALSGPTMLNSFVTTSATPSKCPGRDAPHNVSARLVTRTWVISAFGYISSGDGWKHKINSASLTLRQIFFQRLGIACQVFSCAKLCRIDKYTHHDNIIRLPGCGYQGPVSIMQTLPSSAQNRHFGA